MRHTSTLLLTVALTCIGMASIANAANDRYYVATIKPNDVAAGTTTNYNLVITNNIINGPSHFLRQIIVTVPSAFTISGPVTVQAPPAAPLPWIATVSGHTITVVSGSASDASVTAGQGVTITVPAKSPALSSGCPTTDSYTWGISANQVVGGGSGNAYLLTPGTTNPVVKVSCDNFTNLNLAISPDAIGTTNTSALLTLTATLTKLVGGSLINGELISFTVGGASVTCQNTPITVNGVATCSYFPLPNPLLVAGTYDCQATYAGNASLSLGSSTSQVVKLSVNATDTGLSVSPASGAYGGTVDLSATLTANGSALAGKTVSFSLGANPVGSAVTTATGVATVAGVSLAGIAPGTFGSYIKGVFSGDSTYSAANGDATLTVGLIQPTITWTNPADIVYGTPLSATQLNATASAPGTFVYSPAAGSILNAGNSQTLSVTFTPSDPLTYSTATATVVINVIKATPIIVVTPYSVTYDGAAHTATGTATGVNGASLVGLDLSKTTHTSAADYPNDAWTFIDGSGNYNGATGTVHDSIAKANATIVVTPYNVSYDGGAHTATGTATGAGKVTLSGLVLTGTTHTNAGDYPSDPWTFTDSTGNYNNASGTVHDVIAKANATIVVTPYNVTYDGSPHTATGTATGISNGSLSGLDLSGTTHTGAGDYPADAWTFTDTTGNYNNTSGTVHDAIGKATATIVVTPYNVTYDGTSHTATGTATGVGGVSLTGLVLTGTVHTNAGDYPSDPWTFTDSGNNYNSTSGTVHDVIGKATATVTVTPYSITYDGTSHTATGTATGLGGVSLTGLVLTGTAHTNAGDYPSDPWTFTDAANNYNSTSGTVHDVIGKATATVGVTPYSVTYDGNSHTATGTATGVGGVSLTGLVLTGTTHINAADYPTDSWTFTDSTGNYNNATGTVDDLILKANPTIVVTPYSVTYDGSAHTATGIATGVGGANLGAGLNLSGTTHTNAGDYVGDPWSFTGGTNYNNASGTVHDAISGLGQTITFTSMIVTASATSGGTTMFTSGSPSVCTVTQVLGADNITPVSPGQATVTLLAGQSNWSLCKVLANQNGGTNYNAAPQATATLTTQ